MAKVLVLDDDPSIRGLIAAILTSEGHEVLEAGDTAAAEACLENDPDAAFVDVALPGETGAEFLVRLRLDSRFKNLPATFVTAHVDRAMPLYQAGIAGSRLVSKPFRRETILVALREMLSTNPRRGFFRVHLTNDAVQISLEDQIPRFALNLSLGGVFMLAKNRLPVGEHFRLTVQYRDDTGSCLARVTHVQADGIGFAFHKPSDRFLAFASSTITHMLSAGVAVDERRVETRTMVTAAIVYQSDDTNFSALLRDFSSTGAYVVTDHPPAIGEAAMVYFPGYTYSSGTDQVSELRGCAVQVVRHGPDGFGCRFEAPSAEVKMAISELLGGQSRGR